MTLNLEHRNPDVIRATTINDHRLVILGYPSPASGGGKGPTAIVYHDPSGEFSVDDATDALEISLELDEVARAKAGWTATSTDFQATVSDAVADALAHLNETQTHADQLDAVVNSYQTVYDDE